MSSKLSPSQAVEQLLDARGAGKSICPSEVARIIASPDSDWRAQMDVVHLTVDAMVTDGRIELSWKGKRLSQRRGAYRIARRQPA